MLSFFTSTMAGGGAARAMVNLANHFAARGDAIEIVTLYGGHDAYALHALIQRRDAGLTRARPNPSRASLRAAIRVAASMPQAIALAIDIPTIAHIRDLLLDQPCDAAIGVGDVTAIRLLAAARGLDILVIANEQTDPRAYTIGRWEAARKLLYPHAAAVVVLAEAFGAAWFNARTIPNPVLLPPPSPHTRPNHTVVALGRLSWEKGFGLLIDAFASIAARHPGWTLEIHGEGPERHQLRELVRTHGLTRRVTIAGHTPDPYSVLARASLFVLSSYAEGFPNALCEAMASGVPAIAVECGPGVRTIIRPGIDGLIVPRDRTSLATAMDHLMSEEAQRTAFGERAREVVARFGIESVAAQWDNVLHGSRADSVA